MKTYNVTVKQPSGTFPFLMENVKTYTITAKKWIDAHKKALDLSENEMER